MAPSERNPALARIRTAMIEKKITQAGLADAADCHEKTIQNLMNGRPVRDQTLFDVCMVLGLDFEETKALLRGEPGRDEPGRPSLSREVAPVYMGAYTRAAVEDYIGSYLTLRPGFAGSGTVVAYRTDIVWDPEWPSLLFQERDRPDAPYSHRGRLYVPAASMFIHLVSLTKGAMRMIVVSQLDRLGQMRGLVTTLNKQRATLVPVSAPIVYRKLDSLGGLALGEICAGEPAYAGYRQVLDETVAEGYARLVSI
ncbi:MAG: helix-turn-helix domain-containing protein [Hyphomicrobiaceae bacterium]|nr:helix-turn-helix domain-containing protein [Hyphomicrobiaceae bacterium]